MPAADEDAQAGVCRQDLRRGPGTRPTRPRQLVCRRSADERLRSAIAGAGSALGTRAASTGNKQAECDCSFGTLRLTPQPAVRRAGKTCSTMNGARGRIVRPDRDRAGVADRRAATSLGGWPGICVALVVFAGVLILAGGLGLFGWSLSSHDFSFGIWPSASTLGGQGMLIFGLALAIARLWRKQPLRREQAARGPRPPGPTATHGRRPAGQRTAAGPRPSTPTWFAAQARKCCWPISRGRSISWRRGWVAGCSRHATRAIHLDCERRIAHGPVSAAIDFLLAYGVSVMFVVSLGNLSKSIPIGRVD